MILLLWPSDFFTQAWKLTLKLESNVNHLSLFYKIFLHEHAEPLRNAVSIVFSKDFFYLIVSVLTPLSLCFIIFFLNNNISHTFTVFVGCASLLFSIVAMILYWSNSILISWYEPQAAICLFCVLIMIWVKRSFLSKICF